MATQQLYKYMPKLTDESIRSLNKQAIHCWSSARGLTMATPLWSAPRLRRTLTRPWQGRQSPRTPDCPVLSPSAAVPSAPVPLSCWMHRDKPATCSLIGQKHTMTIYVLRGFTLSEVLPHWWRLKNGSQNEYLCVCVCVCMYVCVYFTMLSKQINNKKSLISLFLYMPLTCNVVKCFESLKVLCKFRIIIIIYIHLYKCRTAPNTNFNLVFWFYFFFSAS